MLAFKISLLILAALLAQVSAWGHRDDPDMPKDPRIMKSMRQDRLKEKLKQRGDLPYDEWYESREYNNFVTQTHDYWQFLRKGIAQFEQLMPNVTRMTAPKYDYYVMSRSLEFRGRGTTWLLCIGPSWYNETLYVGYQMQVALEKLEDRGKAGKYKFAHIEGRFDEYLKLSFDNRQNPSLWVIDSENGTAHHWDRFEFPNNNTIIKWLEDREYTNSTLQMPAPIIVGEFHSKLIHVSLWLRRNIGDRFERWVYRVPGAPFVFQNFVNYEQDDPLGFKRDKVTAFMTPTILIFVIIPLIWKSIKLSFRVTLECCWKEVEVEVEADDPRLLAQNEAEAILKEKLM